MIGHEYWIQAETDSEQNELLDMFRGFHDFRIENVNYTSAHDQIDLLLEYDTREFSVLLRFMGNVSMNFIPLKEYPADWLMGSSIGNTNQGQIVWSGDEDINANDLPNDVLWISGNSLHYVFLDKNGEPQKLPDDMIHQVWHRYNFETREYEDIEKEFHPRYCEFEDDV
ncbi:MAG: hypothetical protein IJU39_07450 [Clostridia bacterium]|nr:hypothetical protein [Clostridia bacterium]